MGVIVTRGQLAAALKTWKREAGDNDWPDRDDDQQFYDSADYLISIILKEQ